MNDTWQDDLHATILYLLGLDHEKLTYRFNGRDMRLTDVHERVIREVLAYLQTTEDNQRTEENFSVFSMITAAISLSVRLNFIQLTLKKYKTLRIY